MQLTLLLRVWPKAVFADSTVDIIHGAVFYKKHDMISQYIAYCRVLDMQVKKHGRTKKAIEETIRICSDKDILKEYLEAHRRLK